MQADILKSLTTTPPAFSLADAERTANEHFGIGARAEQLVSDKDQNFCLETNDGSRFTLKIANYAELQLTVDFQNKALRHVAGQDASLPIPRVIPASNGQLYSSVNHDGRAHIVRVLSWLDGMPMHEGPIGRELTRKLGELLARLGLALSGFDHPGSNPPQMWDMKRAGDLQELLPCIEDPPTSELIGAVLDRFDRHIQPMLDTLRTQVIYNDLNPGNVLLDKTDPQSISGIIDFGDLVKSPLIIDLAIAAAYQLSKGDDPLAGALPLIAGYHVVCPLQQVEMELMIDLILTRLITSLLINTYRTTLFPENREYQMISYKAIKASLVGLSRLHRDAATERIIAVCDNA
jgi:hydroxylysine kinase